MSKEFKPYLATINLKVIHLTESEEFYDMLFAQIFEAKKEIGSEYISYWGPVGLILMEQKDIVSTVDPDFRLGFNKIGIRVSKKSDVDSIYKRMSKNNFAIDYPPKNFPYGKLYYAVGFMDPDYNKIEIFYSEN